MKGQVEKVGLLALGLAHPLQEAQRLRHDQIDNILARVRKVRGLVAAMPVDARLGPAVRAAHVGVVIDRALEVADVLVEAARERRVSPLVESEVPLAEQGRVVPCRLEVLREEGLRQRHAKGHAVRGRSRG